MTPTVSIIDLGIGNILSIQRILQSIDIDSTIITTPDINTHYSCVILPGVGHFDAGISALKAKEFDHYLTHIATFSSTRIVGICLGMQLLCISSEEGNLPGLGLVPAKFRRFPNHLKTPHMGWNTLNLSHKSRPLHLPDPRFYFVHSYYCDPVDNSIVTSSTTYQDLTFCSSYSYNNIIGVQFHPEKSHQHT